MIIAVTQVRGDGGFDQGSTVGSGLYFEGKTNGIW